MRLIKCRKCGATISTDETFVQRMLDAINELSEKARRDKRNSPSYLQQAAAVRKIMQLYLHTTANMDSAYRRLLNEQSVLIYYLRENKLITDEKLHELQSIGRARYEEKEKASAELVAQLYGDFNNISINRTKRDPTERKGMR